MANKDKRDKSTKKGKDKKSPKAKPGGKAKKGGKAKRAKSEAPSEPVRKYNLKIYRNAMTPLCTEDGTKRQFGPYNPVVDACEICPARCCRLTVKVNLPDAIEFCETLGLPFFAAFRFVAGGGERAFEVEFDGRVVADKKEDEWPGNAEIALRRKDDGSCSMLMNHNGYERCGVYSVRPSTCQLYPLTWTSDVARGGPALVMCPVPYGVTPAQEEAFFAAAECSIERWQVHDRVLDEWKAFEPEGGRTAEAFVMFAVPRAAELMDFGTAKVLKPGSPFERLQEAMIAAGVIRLT